LDLIAEPKPKSSPLGKVEISDEGWGGPTNLRTMNQEALAHTLGDHVVNKLASAKEGPTVMKVLGNGTYKNYADLANYEGILKPKALAARTGPEWTEADFKRTVAEHGKELSPNKELVARYLVDTYSPKEITSRTEGWGKVTKSASGASQGAEESISEAAQKYLRSIAPEEGSVDEVRAPNEVGPHTVNLGGRTIDIRGSHRVSGLKRQTKQRTSLSARLIHGSAVRFSPRAVQPHSHPRNWTPRLKDTWGKLAQHSRGLAPRTLMRKLPES
jgi:hypothetical protein